MIGASLAVPFMLICNIDGADEIRRYWKKDCEISVSVSSIKMGQKQILRHGIKIRIRRRLRPSIYAKFIPVAILRSNRD